MKLKTQKLPAEFIQMIPKGFRLIKRNNSDFLLVESLFCPNGHNLIVDSVRIHGEASIKLKVSFNNAEGFIFIDSFWGSHAKLFSFIPSDCRDEMYVDAFCPFCGVQMNEHFTCTQESCRAEKSILLLLPGSKNKIRVCAKLGCPGHHLDISDMAHDLVNVVSQVNYFGAQDNEIFGGI